MAVSNKDNSYNINFKDVLLNLFSIKNLNQLYYFIWI